MGQWLLGVVACAMLTGVAERICPEGAVRRVVRFAGGLLLLCALLRPLSAAEGALPLRGADAYRDALARTEQALEQEARGAFSEGIEQTLEAYIEDKAAGMDTDVRAAVTADSRGVPVGVTVTGTYSAALAEIIERELGIAKEKQVWIEGSGS